MVKNFKFQISNFKLGFSLIELLVVIGIMGTLITILLPNFIGARQRGQDARRKLDLAQIGSALEQYRSVNGSYPATLAELTSGTIYMSTLPSDPTAGYTYQYSVSPGGCTTGGPTYCSDYTVAATLSTTSSCLPASLSSLSNCAPSTACNYCIGPLGAK